ncbi:MAG TPA: alpha/beta hydrolase, partial [Thermoanaerobaculales bacterium]|nr:alpha/beta hydrolase [Thermoanaerobaculales bacterium]
VQGGVELRVMEWWPEQTSQPPLYFVAGWVSVVEGWRPLLEVLVRRRPVVYIETREKRSARIERHRLRVEEFRVQRLAEDLCEVARVHGVDRSSAIWFGSSMGSTALLEALKGARLPARAAFLIGPNATFNFPWWSLPLLRVPAASYSVAKHLVIWYLRHFRVDARREPDQMRRYERTLNAAEPIRLKLSARAAVGYTLWPGLETVTAPVAIAYASSDVLHAESEARSIVATLPAGLAVECPSNTYMHRAEVARDIDEFIAGLP